MKTVLFISSNKVLGQGLSAAIQAKPELDFLWAAQLHYPQAVVGVDIFHADVVILDGDIGYCGSGGYGSGDRDLPTSSAG